MSACSRSKAAQDRRVDAARAAAAHRVPEHELFAVAALCWALELTGCGGGVPGDAVATVDGEPIEHCKDGPQPPTTERRG